MYSIRLVGTGNNVLGQRGCRSKGLRPFKGAEARSRGASSVQRGHTESTENTEIIYSHTESTESTEILIMSCRLCRSHRFFNCPAERAERAEIV